VKRPKVRGVLNGKWKGGVCVNVIRKGKELSYLRITAGPQRGEYVHDLIGAAKIGRPLTKEETVEHIDGDGLNVEPSNLKVVTRPENTRLMHQRRKES
jgi:hypothetical protein